MSNHSSPAQALSVDVLRSIIKWIILEKRSPLHGNSCQLYYLKGLLTVNSTWRQAALEFMWGRISLNINVTTNEVRLNRPKWVKENMLPHNAANFAREIHISAPMSGIVSGIAHKHLVEYIGHTKCFPLANKLIVEITDYKDQYFNTKDIAIANALEFAHLLKSIATTATTIDVICHKDKWYTVNANDNLGSNPDEEILVMFANVLYANTKRANLNMSAVSVEKVSNIDHIPLLSSLVLNCRKAPDVGTSLVRKSASMLQYLKIDLRDANMLIYDTNGEAVIYSNLQYFQLRGCVRSSPNAKEITAKMMPFPLLRTLKLYSSYPFQDDVLFRGNSETLEYLSFRLDYDTIVMLGRRQVFESKQKVLRHVFVSEDFGLGNRGLFLFPEADMVRFLRYLVGSAQSLAVESAFFFDISMVAIQHGQAFNNIKVFDIRIGSPSLFDTLSLLKALPALVNLRSSINGLGLELESISIEELPDYIASTYSDVGKNLQAWALISFTRQGTAQFIDYVLLLALACPKLGRIESTSTITQECHIKVAKALESGPYSKYATQLNRLLKVAH